MSSVLIRIPITVRFFSKENGKMIWSSSSRLKSKIRQLVREASAQNANTEVIMEATVLYSRENDSWNKFEFSSLAEFDRQLAIVTEIGLLRDLEEGGLLDKNNLQRSSDAKVTRRRKRRT